MKKYRIIGKFSWSIEKDYFYPQYKNILGFWCYFVDSYNVVIKYSDINEAYNYIDMLNSNTKFRIYDYPRTLLEKK